MVKVLYRLHGPASAVDANVFFDIMVMSGHVIAHSQH
jgi:hypothetical protein